MTPNTKQLLIYLLLALFVFADVAAFSNRAVNLDEPLFLGVARAPHDWRFITDMNWLFFGTFYSLTTHTHPPAAEYYLALLFRLFRSFREAPFRLLFSVFGMLAAISFYSLAKRFTRSPLLVTLLFLSSPAFFVMSPTLMMDIPMLGFLLAGSALYLHHVEGKSRRLIPAAVCFILAAGCGYAALVPIGVLFLCCLWARRPIGELMAIASAPAALLLWLGLMTLHLGHFPLTATVKYLASRRSSALIALAAPSFLGGVAVFPWLFLLPMAPRKRPLLIGISVAIAALLSYFITWTSVGYGLWFILLASSGVGLLFAFADIALERFRTKPHVELFLILWFPAVLCFFIFVGEFMSARYLLLGLPGLYLIAFSRSASKKLALVLGPTLALSVMIASADYRFVNTYRTWVDANVAPIQEQGFRVWSAAESGLRFYLEQRGIPSLSTADLRPVGGDLIVRHATLFNYSLSEHIETMLMVLKTYELNDPFPVRTFSHAAGAGFHGSFFGVVPYVFSRAPYDVLQLSEISPFVKALPQVAEAGKPIPVWSPAGPILNQTESRLSFPISIPAHAKIQYELNGPGVMTVNDGSVELQKRGNDPIVWKNFRVVPESWPVQGSNSN